MCSFFFYFWCNNAHQKYSLLNTCVFEKFKNNAPKKYKKIQKTHRNCKNHTKNAKNDISGITDILPGFSPYWLSPITSFHHIRDNRYYCDILASVPTLSCILVYLDELKPRPSCLIQRKPHPQSSEWLRTWPKNIEFQVRAVIGPGTKIRRQYRQ